MAIDVTLPLELEDGRKVTFLHIDPYDGELCVKVEGDGMERCFTTAGVHHFGELPNLRNVLPAPIGHNGGPPPDAAPPAPETLADAHAAFYGAEGDLSVLSLPDDDAKRGEYPMADGLLDYFPNALAEVSKVSKIGNDQHNPGEPMNWARDKSTDHANKIMRHLVDRGRFDGRGVRHTARLAWRALAMLQTELEQEEGFPQSRRSTGQAPIQANA